MPSDGDWIYSLSIRRSSVLTSAPLPHYNHKISEKRLAWVIWRCQFRRWRGAICWVTAEGTATAYSLSVNIPVSSREESLKPIVTNYKEWEIILWEYSQIHLVTVFTERDVFPIHTQIFLADETRIKVSWRSLKLSFWSWTIFWQKPELISSKQFKVRQIQCGEGWDIGCLVAGCRKRLPWPTSSL